MTTASHAFLSTAAPRSRRASCRGVGAREIRGNLFSVQVMRCDVPLDRGRHLAHDRTPALDVFADGSGRYIRGAVRADGHPAALDPPPPEVRCILPPAPPPPPHPNPP